jgi:hypothetical protein
MALPIIAPAITSQGKCTASTIRDNAIAAAHKKKGLYGPNNNIPAIVAKQNAADVWPEGKLN